MQSRYSPQFDFDLAVGAKLSTSVYLGGYAGIGAGNEGNDPYTDQLCSGGYTTSRAAPTRRGSASSSSTISSRPAS
jgi:hypothetical protein